MILEKVIIWLENRKFNDSAYGIRVACSQKNMAFKGHACTS
jgi:hypothetical protein